MTQAAEIAEELLDILGAHIEIADMWDDHWSAAMGGRFTRQQEKASAAAINAEKAPAFTKIYKQAGYTYMDLVDIIPIAFKTTREERAELLEDLVEFAYQEYGALPF